MPLRPNPADLERLKTPFGKLIPGPPDDTIPKLKEIVQATRPPLIVAVGDVVSRETLKAGIRTDLRIVDHRSMRKDLSTATYPSKKSFNVKNPPGVITREAEEAIRLAIGQEDSVIYVDGEEDLLVLPVILEAPPGSLVLYGQPSEGLVVVTVTEEKKRDVSGIMRRMIKE